MELHIFFGPTATSKTKIAQAFWEKHHYPILSVDSRKVYKLADIGTNKLSILEFKQMYPAVLFGGTDFLEPSAPVSVHIYQQYVYQWISEHLAEIEKAGGLIIHGGTGLYLDAILEGRTLLNPENSELRQELEHATVEELQKRAQKENPSGYSNMNDSDQKNPRRLIRVIENKELQEKPRVSTHPSAKFFSEAVKHWHIDIPPREVYNEAINTRVYKYLEQGWLDEVYKLLVQYGESAPALQMMGYRQLVQFILENEQWRDLAENKMPAFVSVIDVIQQEHRQYAKRQETWSKKYLKEAV